ncbi:MAG: SIMPL domain-containing protein [Verrucomicrobiia bacterium]|jgi:hypothetical protein
MKTFAAVLALTIIAASSAPAQFELSMDTGRSKISVNGEAVVYVTPDKIVIHLGIETDNKDVIVAKQKNNEILKDALAAIKGHGVAERDIQTDHLSIEPRWMDNMRRKDFLDYRVRNSLSVTLADVAKLEKLITQLLDAGVNHIDGIEFQTTEFKKHREQAREMALKAAKEKAVKMAAVLGQTIGAPINIAEGYDNYSSTYYSCWSGWSYGRSEPMSQASSRVEHSGAEGTDTVALGKLGIRANVSVSFELKK